jgi:branched-chain amino acid transport system ATP-binding protein
MSTAVLTAHDLYAGYQGVPAVRGLEISVQPGEVVALLGPNGAGKTTTIMTLAGVLPPISGTVMLDGKATTESLFRRARRGLALLTEQRAVAMGLSTFDNLRLGKSNPERALELFPELKARLSIRAGFLSGGEQQMLAIARILSMDARVLLADEVSLGLAPRVTERLLAAIRDAADRGLGALLVEQLANKAVAVADRCVVLVRGQVRLDCPASDLRGDVGRLSSLYFD